jgi:hypothetical protein
MVSKSKPRIEMRMPLDHPDYVRIQKVTGLLTPTDVVMTVLFLSIGTLADHLEGFDYSTTRAAVDAVKHTEQQ